MTIALDLDPDILNVAERAAGVLGVDRVLDMLATGEGRCCRAAASDRLFLRRHSAGRPAPGEAWSYLDHLHLIDAEMARMGASREAAAGCGRTDCPLCFTPGIESMASDNTNPIEFAAIVDRYYEALASLAETVAAEAEQLTREPADPERLLGLLGRLVILSRLSEGGRLPAELIRAFFDEATPLPDPVPAVDPDEFAEALGRLLAYLNARHAKPTVAEITAA